jgi:hypothetical protein
LYEVADLGAGGVGPDDFEAAWALPSTSSPPFNEDSIFAFDETFGVDITPASFAGLSFDGFETGWKNDAGLRDNFDAIPTEEALFDSGTSLYEDFENTWVLPLTGGPPFNESRTISFEEFIDGTVLPPYVIQTGINDILSIRFTQGGTLADQNVTLDPDTYTAATMASEIHTKVDAALTADAGPANAAHFSAVVSPGGTVRLITAYDGSPPPVPLMELLIPPSDTVWPTLGFTPGAATGKGTEDNFLKSAVFDVANTLFEDYEDEWRSNENSIFSFTGPPTDLESASFDVANTAFEDFENEWTLTI